MGHPVGARDRVPLRGRRGERVCAEGDPEPPALGADPAGRQQAVRHRVVAPHRRLQQGPRRSRHGKILVCVLNLELGAVLVLL